MRSFTARALVVCAALLVGFPPSAFAQRIAGGFYHSVAVADDGAVYAWGWNAHGQIGDGTMTSRSTPVRVPALAGVVAVAAGAHHNLALRSDGTVWGWGYDYNGELGDGGSSPRYAPVRTGSLTGVTAIAAGHFHSLALLADGTVYAWGSNTNGQLGVGDTTTRRVPTLVPALTSIVAIAAGSNFSVAVRSDGTVWSWGGNGSGRLGDGTTTQRTAPVQVSGITDAVAAAAGGSHALALRSNGTVSAWGGNGAGQLGDGTYVDRWTPIGVGGVSGVTRLAAGEAHSAVVGGGGVLWTWGYNGYGQLATAGASYRPTPAAVTTLSGVIDTGAGHHHTLALTGTHVYGAGANGYWQLGDGTATNRPLPVVIAESGFVANAAAPTFTPAAGTYSQALSVTITTATSGGTIRYTVDGTEPSESSAVYTTPLAVEATTTVKARAFHASLAPSSTRSATYHLAAATPTVTPGTGTYASAQTVTISSSAGATIHYTLDGTTPTITSPVYTEPLTIDGPAWLKAVAVRAGWDTSGIATAGYSFSTYEPPSPTPSMPAGRYCAPFEVTFSSQAEPRVFYTTDGSDPRINGRGYVDPIPITRTTTVTSALRATQPDGQVTWSDPGGHTYVLQVCGPDISLGPGEYAPGTLIRVTSTTPNAVLRYRVDGQTPTLTDPIVPSDGTLMVGSFTLSVRGFFGEMEPSAVATAVYTTPWSYNSGALVGGQDHSVALLPNGTVLTWGSNASRQLGWGDGGTYNPTVAQSTTPGTAGVTGVKAIAGGMAFTIALRHDGTVWTWGRNDTGMRQLGRETCAVPESPAWCVRPDPIGLTNIVAIAAGSYHGLALDAQGFIWAWGGNGSGELGDGTTTSRAQPQIVAALTGVTAIAAGYGTSYARLANGTVWAWGANALGQAGDVGSANRLTPVQVSNVTEAAAIGAGTANGYAVDGSSALWLWGNYNNGQLGNGTTNPNPGSLPAVLGGVGAVRSATGGNWHTLVLEQSGAVLATGSNSYGQLGDGTTTQRLTATATVGLPPMRAIAAGWMHSLAIGRDDSGWAWGRGQYGLIGNGATTDQPTAVEVFPAGTFDGCQPARVTPATATVQADGGSLTFDVKVAWDCEWTATSDSGFATFAQPVAIGSGTATVSFALNPGPARTATLTIAGQTVTVTQAGGAVVPPTNEEISYVHTDAIGSVRMITSATGVVVARYDYLPFGVEAGTSQPGSIANTVKFTGKERDVDTAAGGWLALDYFGARYYHSQTGRFTTVDPFLDQEAAILDPQRWSRYTYALNNPLKFTDPDGRDPRVVGAVIGVAVYSGWNAYVNVQQGRPWYQNIGIEASKGLLVGVTLGLAAPALAGRTTAEIGLLTTTGSTIAGPLGTITRSELDRAINAGGQTIELVTKLTQSPAAGRALSAAGGEGAQALAAASRTAGNLYMARIPEHTIKLLERAGLVTIQKTMMNGVRGIEYRFRPEAMEYLARYFEEIPQ